MKILQICNKPPLPSVDGGTYDMNTLAQGLMNAGAKVRIFSVCSDKHPLVEFSMTKDYMEQTQFDAEYIDLGIHPLKAAAAWLSGESYHVKRYISEVFNDRLTAILKSDTFDIVLVESIFLAPYLETIRRHSTARVVLHAPNVEHEIWQGAAEHCRLPLKRRYLKHLALTLSAYERERCRLFDGVICLTQENADFFRKQGCRHVMVKPFSTTLPILQPLLKPIPHSLYHLGSMDWQANLQSVKWFLHSVWPQVHETLPQVTLHLAGRKMPEDLLRTAMPNVYIEGEVPDADGYISDKQINIVPLLYGSGMRVKIIEAMAAGKVVISTHKGAAGIACTDGQDILLADTPKEFLYQIQRCVEDPMLCDTLATNARRLVSSQYNTRTLTRQLLDFFASLLPKQ